MPDPGVLAQYGESQQLLRGRCSSEDFLQTIPGEVRAGLAAGQVGFWSIFCLHFLTKSFRSLRLECVLFEDKQNLFLANYKSKLRKVNDINRNKVIYSY